MSRATFAVTLDAGEEYRASALGRVQRLLDEERRRGAALADDMRDLLRETSIAEVQDSVRAALAAWEGR